MEELGEARTSFCRCGKGSRIKVYGSETVICNNRTIGIGHAVEMDFLIFL